MASKTTISLSCCACSARTPPQHDLEGGKLAREQTRYWLITNGWLTLPVAEPRRPHGLVICNACVEEVDGLSHPPVLEEQQ